MQNLNMIIRIVLFIVSILNLLLYFGVWVMLEKEEDRRVNRYIIFMIFINIVGCFLIGLLK